MPGLLRKTLHCGAARFKKKRGGTTLMEIVIAVLVLGMTAAAVMPVFLTSAMSTKRVDRRQAAVDCIRRLTEELKGYVAADHINVTGPGGGTNGWYLPGDTSGKWALQEGAHSLDPRVWCPSLADCAVAVSYTVTVRYTMSGPQPDVSVTVDWDGSK